mmetsp:Transcript_397/g.1547  ORF Transcript_397/g.1547 Transcript_397/m.1547 type:complete len:257 (+) Transcript_397:1484-2254(+)
MPPLASTGPITWPRHSSPWRSPWLQHALLGRSRLTATNALLSSSQRPCGRGWMRSRALTRTDSLTRRKSAPPAVAGRAIRSDHRLASQLASPTNTATRSAKSCACSVRCRSEHSTHSIWGRASSIQKCVSMCAIPRPSVGLAYPSAQRPPDGTRDLAQFSLSKRSGTWTTRCSSRGSRQWARGERVLHKLPPAADRRRERPRGHRVGGACNRVVRAHANSRVLLTRWCRLLCSQISPTARARTCSRKPKPSWRVRY